MVHNSEKLHVCVCVCRYRYRYIRVEKSVLLASVGGEVRVLSTALVQGNLLFSSFNPPTHTLFLVEHLPHLSSLE